MTALPKTLVYGQTGQRLAGPRWAVRIAHLLGVRAVATYGQYEPPVASNGTTFTTSEARAAT